MRFEHDGMSLWYGTHDAPGPTEVVAPGTEVIITVGVEPPDASNRIEVSFRVNGGPTQTAPTRWLRSSPSSEAQYFEARLGPFRGGDTVEYNAICKCAGRHVPPTEEATKFAASFRVTEKTLLAMPSKEALPLPTANVNATRGNDGSSNRTALISPEAVAITTGGEMEDRRSALINPGERDVTIADVHLPEREGLLVPIISPIQPGETDGFVVRGSVQSPDGQPLSGAVVRAFDRDLRKEQRLGEAKTDEAGQYIIHYSSRQFATGDVLSASAPSLIVRAFANDQQLGEEVTRPKPTRDEVVDFKVSAPVLSEWEKVSAGVIPLLKGQGEGDETLPPWGINDSDLKFIAEETGLEREHIRLWALAFAVGRDALEVQPAAPISTTGPMTHYQLQAPQAIYLPLRSSMAGSAWVYRPTLQNCGRIQPIA